MPVTPRDISICKGSEMPLPWFVRDQFHKSKQRITVEESLGLSEASFINLNTEMMWRSHYDCHSLNRIHQAC